MKSTMLFTALGLLVTSVAQALAGESVWRHELNAYNIAGIRMLRLTLPASARTQNDDVVKLILAN